MSVLRKKSPTWLIALATGVVTAAALAHVWVRLQMLSVGYDISRETKWRHDLGEQSQRLTLELRTRMEAAAGRREFEGFRGGDSRQRMGIGTFAYSPFF